MSVDEFSYELNMLPLIFFYDTGCGAALPLSEARHLLHQCSPHLRTFFRPNSAPSQSTSNLLHAHIKGDSVAAAG